MASEEQTLSSAVPNEISEILKREFNTGVPQIATLAAVVAGTFGVSKIFNAGVWTVVAILTFVFIFLFQQQISSNVPRTTIFVVVLLGCTAALLVSGYARSGTAEGFHKWCEDQGILVTGIVSAGVTASIALLTVSYRKQQRWGGVRYPDIIEDAVMKQLNSSSFYKSKVNFSITLLDSDANSINIETTHSYEVVNRFEDRNTWVAEYELNDADGKVIELTIDGQPENIEGFSGSRIVRVAVPMSGHQRRLVMIKVHDRFRIVDSDIYTSYHPATDLRVEFTNTKSPALTVEFDTLHVSRYSPGRNGATRFLHIPDGVLPFEGVRLRWRPTP